jgi:hypothetical protein
MRGLMVILVQGLGCSDAVPVSHADPVSPAAPASPAEPEVLMSDSTPPDAADPYAPTYGAEVTREAHYTVAPWAGGKRLQAVVLRFDDGEEWIRSYRPVADEFQFADKRVVVTGRPYTNSPNVQSVYGTHFEVRTIDLAPGETPYSPLPSELPAPPQVRDLAGIEARTGRWAHVIGDVETMSDPARDDRWSHHGRLRLESGEAVEFEHRLSGEDQAGFVGQRVTLLARVLGAGTAASSAPRLSAVAVCAGEKTHCQMTMAQAGEGGRKYPSSVTRP